MRPHQVDLPVELSRNECALRSGTARYRQKTTRREFRTGTGLRRGGTSSFVTSNRAGDCDRGGCCDSSAMYRLQRFADDFFDSHFFALRFTVGSQCPKFDSHAAMRCRVSLLLPGMSLLWKFGLHVQCEDAFSSVPSLHFPASISS